MNRLYTCTCTPTLHTLVTFQLDSISENRQRKRKVVLGAKGVVMTIAMAMAMEKGVATAIAFSEHFSEHLPTSLTEAKTTMR